MVKNSAFVFIKPHALTEKTQELVKETFEKQHLTVKKEGRLEAEVIDKKQLVDKHYYAIASKATLLTPDKLNVPKEKFKEKFGVEWDEVLKSETALNAKGACEKFEVDSDELDKMWGAAKKAGDIVKLGGGFYCAKLSPEGKGTYYVFNGFFMSMRSKFVAEGVAIYYYVVEWDSKALSWEDFRGKVLGPTDPATAPEDSLRGAILAKYKELGLTSEPNTGDNGVHASASPFEGLAERMNWLGYRVEQDPFGKLLLKGGVTRRQIKDWSLDPQVTYGVVPMTKSLFDSLEDTDTDYCAALCQMIGGCCGPKDKTSDLEAEIAKLKEQIESFKPLLTAVAAIQAFTPPKLKAEPRTNAKEEPKGEAKGKGKGKKEKEPEPPLRKGQGGGGKGKSGGGGKAKGKGRGKGKY